MKIIIAANVVPSRALVWGLVLMAPGAFFLLANVLNEFGIHVLYAPIGALTSDIDRRWVFNLVSPVLFIGGLAGALLLNTLAMTTLEVQWVENRVVGTVSIEPRTPNMALVVSLGLLLVTFAGYGFVENFRLISTH